MGTAEQGNNFAKDCAQDEIVVRSLKNIRRTSENRGQERRQSGEANLSKLVTKGTDEEAMTDEERLRSDRKPAHRDAISLRFPDPDFRFFVAFFDTIVIWTFFAAAIGLCYFYANYNVNAGETGDYRINPESVAEKILAIFLRCLYGINLFYLFLNAYVLFPRGISPSPQSFKFDRYGNKNTDMHDPEKERRVIFRFVTRGTNFDAIEKASLNMYNLLEDRLRVPSSLWVIEIVTDNDLGSEDEGGAGCLSVLSVDDIELGGMKTNCVQTLVPQKYEVSYEGEPAKYKARALQYALDTDANPHCVAKSIDWIVHLDEESTMSGAAVKEIFHYIQLQDDISATTLKPPRIGQGAIHYSGNYEYEGLQHFICTFCDSIRVTDDYGKFRLQFSLGVPLVGMKGSFIVIRQDVEQSIGFNNGRAGNITEDAFVAIKAWDMGYKFAFIPTNVEERSPFTFMDFIRQRERWFRGLVKVVLSNQLKLRHRAFLGVMTFFWGMSWVGWLATISSFVVRLSLPPEIEYLLALLLGVFVFVHCFGFYTQFQVQPVGKSSLRWILGTVRYVLCFGCQIVAIPIATFAESISVIYYFGKKLRGYFGNSQDDFFVVKK